MKIIIVCIFIILIFYFIWQFVKRSIFFRIFKTFNDISQNAASSGEEYSQSTKNKGFKRDIKWDAETIEYEEIPDFKDKSD